MNEEKEKEAYREIMRKMEEAYKEAIKAIALGKISELLPDAILAKVIPDERNIIIGEVIMTGDDVKRVKCGDKIIFKPFSGIEIDKGRFVLLKQSDIYAIVKE